ncbi:MAG TPA: energy-coupling factor transporter transmembrane component T [Candidatus Micrarchaeia archaeon]|nr:energy-coupling factor transporter transmembrane component T [Candidatus Micrarchaeia archaeon]
MALRPGQGPSGSAAAAQGAVTEQTGPDPRALGAWVAAVVLVVLGSDDPVVRVLALAAALLLLARGRGRHAGLRRPLVLVGAAAAGTIVLNTLLSHTGADVVVSLPGWLPGVGGPLTAEALLFGIDIALGLSACLVAALTLARLVEPEALAGALPGPLRHTGAALGAALTLAPRLAQGVTAIREAQAMRGWRPRGLRSWAAVVVPAVLTAIEGSLQLAEAMEARGYGAGRRSAYRERHWGVGDTVLGCCAVLALGLFAAAALTGGNPGWYPYPTPTAPAASPLLLAACAVLVLPAAAA